MATALPVSNLINVAVVLTPQGAQAQNLNTLLFLSGVAEIDTVEQYRTYSSLTDVGLDFGANDPAYLTAQLWFAQSPQPREYIVARWWPTGARGGLRGGVLTPTQANIANWTAITAGSFRITVNGGAPTNVTGLNFSAATTLEGVAGVIQAVLGAPVTCTYNSRFNRFEFISTTASGTSAVGFLEAAGTGTDISAQLNCRSTDAVDGAYTYPGRASEGFSTPIVRIDELIGQQFYAIATANTDDDTAVEIARVVEGLRNKHIYGYTTTSASVLLSATTTDVASQLKDLGIRRTLCCYSSTEPYAHASSLARLVSVDYTGGGTTLTLMFKQMPLVAPEAITTSQATVLRSKNCNVFTRYDNDTSIFQFGVMGDGTFADIVTGTDWLAVTVQTALYNLLYTTPTKIPQTDAGAQLMTTTVESICAQGVNNGLLAPGVWNSAGFGPLKQGDYLPKGYLVHAPRVDTQTVADRTARRSVPIQVAAKLAGAVHEVNMTISVNQ